MRKIIILSLFVMICAGCGQKKEEAPIASSTTNAVSTTQTLSVDPATTGALKGKVIFEGVPPPRTQISVGGNPECAVMHPGGKIESQELVVNQGALQNAFVYIKEGLENYKFDAPTSSAEIDNKNCMYVPHVSGAQVGQPIIFLNSDQTLHNIHAYPKANKAWNIGLPFQGVKQTRKFDSPEVMVSLKCDVHPWMSGYVGILPHPYFAVSGTDGSFEIKNIPAGKFTVEAWHEKLGVQSQTVEINAKETKELEFKFNS